MFKNSFESTANQVLFRPGVLRIFATVGIATTLLLSPLQMHAQDEDTVESLQAKIASMEKQFAAVTKDRDALYDQLSATIDEIEALESKTADIDTGRTHIREKYFALSEESSTRQANDEAEMNRLVGSSLAQIKSALKERDDALASIAASDKKTASARNGNALTRNQLINAKQNISSLENRIGFLEIQLAKAEGDLAAANSRASSSENRLAFLEIQLAKSQGDLAAASSQAAAAEAIVASGPPVDWADKLSDSLSAQYSGLKDVEVSALPGNRVAVRIGNSGLFRSGASRLSGQGGRLLSRIGDALIGQTDTRILVLGHTDNIPVGSDSSYVDNTDLSNRRALEAMRHLGDAVGIPFDRLSSTGLADNYPIASNDTSEGRSQNRRIELELSPLRDSAKLGQAQKIARQKQLNRKYTPGHHLPGVL